MRSIGLALCLLTITEFFSFEAVAQKIAPCGPGSTANGEFGTNMAKGSPFFATARITFEQRLPDGNSIQSYSVFHQARNTKGMTRDEAPQRCFKSVDGTYKLAYSIRVYDPDDKLFRYWSVYGDTIGWRPNVVHVQPYPPLESLQPDAVQQERSNAANEWSATEHKTEDLGLKTMMGISVHGSRSTRTIPAGKEGNTLELVVTDEYWRSDSLGQNLLVIHDDPRVGKTTYAVEELILGEPDPSLFVAPTGYVVEPVRPA